MSSFGPASSYLVATGKLRGGKSAFSGFPSASPPFTGARFTYQSSDAPVSGFAQMKPKSYTQQDGRHERDILLCLYIDVAPTIRNVARLVTQPSELARDATLVTAVGSIDA